APGHGRPVLHRPPRHPHHRHLTAPQGRAQFMIAVDYPRHVTKTHHDHGWASAPRPGYSHSMVAGGLLVMSRTTRLISWTSLVIRVEIVASTWSGSRAQSAVIASSLVTGRSTTG